MPPGIFRRYFAPNNYISGEPQEIRFGGGEMPFDKAKLRGSYILENLQTKPLVADGIRPSARRARILCLVIALASVTRSAYIKFVKFPDRPIAEIGVPDNDWGRVMAWARGTPHDTGWLAHPGHAVQYGTSLRVAGERDVAVAFGQVFQGFLHQLDGIGE